MNHESQTVQYQGGEIPLRIEAQSGAKEPTKGTGSIKENQTIFSEKDLKRFWSKVDKSGDCWLWIGGKSRGYGQFNLKNKNYFSHRLSYMLHIGLIPKGLLVCHKCDNRPCVNPSHFFLGTIQDNLFDMRSKGRQAKGDTHGSRTHPESVPRGEKNVGAKLKDCDITKIRSIYSQWRTPHRIIGEMFGVSRPIITRIISRDRWKHVA